LTNQVRGVVQRTFEKEFNNKLLHSFTIKGQDGFFGCGTRRPPVEAGKSYEFEFSVDPKGRKNVNLNTLRPWESGEAISAPNVGSMVGKNPNKSGGSEKFWEEKAAREIRNDGLRELGATRNTALTLVTLMLSNGAIKLPTKEANKEEVIYKLFEHYTAELLKAQTPEAQPEVAEAKVATDDAAEEEAEWK
jgi:hypothetical protein